MRFARLVRSSYYNICGALTFICHSRLCLQRIVIDLQISRADNCMCFLGEIYASRHMMHIGFCDIFRATFNDFAYPFSFRG